MKKTPLIILVSILLSSCITSRLNYFGETPKKPGRYPAFTHKDSLKGYLDDYRKGYDVAFYDLNLTLDPRHKKLGGKVTMTFRALEDLTTLRFDLYRNLKIYSINFSGKELSYKRHDRSVYLQNCPMFLKEGKIIRSRFPMEELPRRQGNHHGGEGWYGKRIKAEIHG